MPHAASLSVERLALLGLLMADVCLLVGKERLSSLLVVHIVVATNITLRKEVLGLSWSHLSEDGHVPVEEVLSYRS